MRKLYQLLVIGICILTLVSCSSSKAEYDNSYSGEVIAPEASYGDSLEDSELSLDENSNVDDTARKLIRDVKLQVETKGFDSLIADLNERVKAMGGYVEQSDISGLTYETERGERNATLTYRVPAEKLDEFLAHIGENCNITQRSEQSRDVTLTYVDLESRIKALETERDALLALLEQADSTSSILAIRDQLSDIIYQYESATAQLRTLSEQVDYSTVSMNIYEVLEYTKSEEQSMWEQISTGFVRSCRDIVSGVGKIVTFFAVNSPYLLILALILGGGIGILHLLLTRKSRAEKKRK